MDAAPHTTVYKVRKIECMGKETWYVMAHRTNGMAHLVERYTSEIVANFMRDRLNETAIHVVESQVTIEIFPAAQHFS